MNTPLFSTLHFIDRIIRCVTPLLFCSTEAEASFIGYALLDLLQVVNHWHDCEESVFNSEARCKVGFSVPLSTLQKGVSPTGTAAPPQISESSTTNAIVDSNGESKDDSVLASAEDVPDPTSASKESSTAMAVVEELVEVQDSAPGISQRKFKDICKVIRMILWMCVKQISFKSMVRFYG